MDIKLPSGWFRITGFSGTRLTALYGNARFPLLYVCTRQRKPCTEVVSNQYVLATLKVYGRTRTLNRLTPWLDTPEAAIAYWEMARGH